jgi:RNA polymerase sigma-70 factor (ECF subfamily)
VLERPSLGGAEPERGRFRSYLLGALKHFLGHRREREAREKRGGGRETLPLSVATDTSPGIDPADGQTLPPIVSSTGMGVACRAYGAGNGRGRMGSGRRDRRIRPPKAHLNGDAAHGALGALARAQGINEVTLRSMLHRLRRSFRHAVKAQLAPTLASREEVEDEMRALLLALADG